MGYENLNSYPELKLLAEYFDKKHGSGKFKSFLENYVQENHKTPETNPGFAAMERVMGSRNLFFEVMDDYRWTQISTEIRAKKLDHLIMSAGENNQEEPKPPQMRM